MVHKTTMIRGFADTIAWYEENAAEYAQIIADKGNHHLIQEFVEAVRRTELDLEVLDAGCAAGRDSNLLSQAGMQVTGIDIAHNLLAIARKKYPQLQFIEGTFLNLPFPANSFSGIWANASLVHLETIAEVRKALREFHRVLKPGGVLHVFVKQGDGQTTTSVVTDAISKHERFFRWFTVVEISRLLTESDFVIDLLRDTVADTAGRSEVSWIHVLTHKT